MPPHGPFLSLSSALPWGGCGPGWALFTCSKAATARLSIVAAQTSRGEQAPCTHSCCGRVVANLMPS